MISGVSTNLTTLYLLLIAGFVSGKIYFEENFDDDSWTERWEKSIYAKNKTGKFQRSAGRYHSSTNNTGLRTMENDKFYLLTSQFPEPVPENSTVVLQFSVKYDQEYVSGDDAHIRLYNGDFEPSRVNHKTGYLVMFGAATCRGVQWFCIRFTYLGRQGIQSQAELQVDEYTHVYTVIIQPDLSYQLLVDGKKVPEDRIVHLSLVADKITKTYKNNNRRISGIGFYMQPGKNGTIFDNMLVSDDVTVAQKKINDVLKLQAAERKLMLSQDDNEEAHARIHQFGWLVNIKSEHLANILDHKGNLEFTADNHHTERFLTNYNKFLVSFNWSDDNSIIKKSAEYNRNRFNPGVYPYSIQLWISFQPRNDISDDIESVMEYVDKANSIFPETVTAIIINYGLLQLDAEALPFVNHEIGKVSRRLKLSPYSTPKLGLQVSEENCRKNYFTNLGQRLLDILVMVPMPHEKDYFAKEILIRDRLWYTCHTAAQLMDTKVSVVLHAHASIEMDLTKRAYRYDRKAMPIPVDYILRQDGISLLVHTSAESLSSNTSHDQHTRSFPKNFVNWLYRSSDFSKSHFGAVFDWEESTNMGVQNFTSTILPTFQHILIDSRFHGTTENQDNIKQTVQAMADYSRALRKQNSRSDRNSKSPPNLFVSLLVTVTTNDSEVNQRQVDQVISKVVMMANSIYPGVVSTIYLDWVRCIRSEVCSGYPAIKVRTACEEFKAQRQFLNILTYANNSLSKFGVHSGVSVGIALDRTFLNNQMKMFANLKSCHANLSEINRTNAFLFKTVVHHDKIAVYGGLKVSKAVIADLEYCMTFVSVIPPSAFVKVIGCVGHTNMTLLVEYVRLMENLNAWAKRQNILLFTNAGVEVSANYSESAAFPEKRHSNCGWWIQQNSSGKYQDKKSVARQFYEETIEKPLLTDKKPTTTTLHPETLLWILIPFAIVVLLISVTTSFLVRHYQSKYILTKQEIAEFVRGQRNTRAEPGLNGDTEADTQSYNSDKYELTPSEFTIDITSECLGSGEFGKVYSGSIKVDGVERQVAVKMTNARVIHKGHGYYLALKALLSEIKILTYVGEHSHIVSLLGAYTKRARKGEIAVFLERCQLGSLEKYLQTMKPQEAQQTSCRTSNASGYSSREDVNTNVLSEDAYTQLYRWAREIANGMEFIASKKLVHGDLAARNVLLTVDKIAKISDFGLSRRLYDYTEYVKQSQAPLPWRWMAPESLCRMVFNEKTDVWAFGVTMWEIFTLGDQPYPGLSYNTNIVTLLERGLRLYEPIYSRKETYSVMMRCWDMNSALRPTFAQLRSELSSAQ